MADLDRIKRNIQKMVSMSAPESDIDAYIASEGVSLDAIRSHKLQREMAHPATPFKPNYDPARSASAADIMKASFAEDPQYRAKYYAQQMGIPEDRIDIDQGIPSYKADDGQWYYLESPDMLPGSLGQAADVVSRVPGPALSDIPPAVAGVATAPLWLTGPAGAGASLATTASAATLGSSARQKLAEEITGQPISGGRLARDVGMNVALEGLGGAGVKFGQRGLAKDIGRMDLPEVEAIRAKADELGIDLTPAELTGLGSLAAEQKRLGNVIDSQAILEDFYLKRLGQIEDAVGGTLGRIAPETSPELVGRGLIEKSGEAIKGAKQARKEVSEPFYRQVMDNPGNVLTDEQMAGLMTGEGGRADEFLMSAFDRVLKDPLQGGDLAGLPPGHVRVLDAVKKNLDDQIDSAIRAGEGNKARLLEQRRERLVGIADYAMPDYPKAREAFAGMSPQVNELEESMIGVISKLKSKDAIKSVEKVMSARNIAPNDVRKARKAIEGTKGGKKVWAQVKRQWIEDAWLKAGREYASSPDNVDRGAKFRSLLFGDKKQRENLMAALNPSEFKAIEDLMDVLKASGRVKKIGSDTAWNQIVDQAARDKSKPWLSKIVANINPAQLLRTADDFFSDRALDKYSARMAEVITNPAMHSKLREIRQMSPGSAQFRVAVPFFLLQGGAVANQQGGRSGSQQQTQAGPLE